MKASATPTVIDIPAGKVLKSTALMFDPLNGLFELKYDPGDGNKIERGDFELLARSENVLQISPSIGPEFFVGPSEMSQSGSDLLEWSTLAAETVGSVSISRYFRIAVGD